MHRNKLERYQQKRDFNRTSEPRDHDSSNEYNNVFVVQQHNARRHHYDFRLQSGDVLKSWAVPKGPSTDPRDKRLAAPTEDHPLDYADFEGVIPEGEYGAGAVILWDKGQYINVRAEKSDDGADLEQSYQQGKIEIRLEGEKLKGEYALIKMKKTGQWILIKTRDEEADARKNPVSTQPKSVKSGQTLKELEKKHQ